VYTRDFRGENVAKKIPNADMSKGVLGFNPRCDGNPKFVVDRVEFANFVWTSAGQNELFWLDSPPSARSAPMCAPKRKKKVESKKKSHPKSVSNLHTLRLVDKENNVQMLARVS
jgi:hypothetical protein